MAEHVPTQCDDCEKTDDHPKIHYGEETYHFDCLPPRVRRDVTGADHPAHHTLKKIIKECEQGTKGADLRAFVVDLHDDSAKGA